MTIPSERMRALRWGAELLREIVQDDQVDVGLRQRAEQLMPAYPTAEALLDLVLSDAPAMPMPWAESIEAARMLFRDLGLRGDGTGVTRRKLELTHRHFAEPGILHHWTKTAKGFSIQTWLLPEGNITGSIPKRKASKSP